jgi:hypothetical protein
MAKVVKTGKDVKKLAKLVKSIDGKIAKVQKAAAKYELKSDAKKQKYTDRIAKLEAKKKELSGKGSKKTSASKDDVKKSVKKAKKTAAKKSPAKK